METCRNISATFLRAEVRAHAKGSVCLASETMASLTLKNIKKLYPHSADEEKKQKKKAKAKKKVDEVPSEGKELYYYKPDDIMLGG